MLCAFLRLEEKLSAPLQEMWMHEIKRIKNVKVNKTIHGLELGGATPNHPTKNN